MLIRRRKLENTQQNGQNQENKRQTSIYKIVHRTLKIEQHEHTKNRWWTRMVRNGRQFFLHAWLSSFYSCY